MTPVRSDVLTDTEFVVLKMISEGYTDRFGASAIGMSRNTWRTHVQRIHGRLHAHTNAQCVAIAMRRGWLN